MAGVGAPVLHSFLGAISRSRSTEPICPFPDCLFWGCRVGAAGSSASLDWKEDCLGRWSSLFGPGLRKRAALVSGDHPLLVTPSWVSVGRDPAPLYVTLRLPRQSSDKQREKLIIISINTEKGLIPFLIKCVKRTKSNDLNIIEAKNKHSTTDVVCGGRRWEARQR